MLMWHTLPSHMHMNRNKNKEILKIKSRDNIFNMFENL